MLAFEVSINGKRQGTLHHDAVHGTTPKSARNEVGVLKLNAGTL